MKILLLKPISDVYYVIQPNLGLGYLASIMEEKHHEVQILDSGKESLTWKKFSDIVKQGRFDIIGIQMFTHEVLSVKKHIEIIKKVSPETMIIVGGAHVSGDPVGTMDFMKDLDFGFVGEAEIGMEKFFELKKKDYKNADLLKKIPNLVWRNNDKVEINKKECHEQLDLIKFPAWHLMKPSEYPVAPHGNFCKKSPVAPMIISRGCPFQCTFCAGKAVTGPRLRYRSLGNVIKELMILYDKYKVREIHIEDDNFTMKRDYVEAFCNEIINRKLDLAFALPNGVRLDTLDKELLELMEKAGFYSMGVGIESGSNRILKLMKKSLSKEKVREKIELIKKYTHIDITGFFLMGYPSETEEEIKETIEFAKSLNIDKASFMFLMPLPGSELWNLYTQKMGHDIPWENFFYYRIVPGLATVSAEKLRKLQRRAMRQFYLRPKIMLGLAKEIKTYSQVKIIAKRFTNIFLKKS